MKKLLKNLLYSFILVVLVLLVATIFPSRGHPPLEWSEVFERWPITVMVFIIAFFKLYWSGDVDKELRETLKFWPGVLVGIFVIAILVLIIVGEE